MYSEKKRGYFEESLRRLRAEPTLPGNLRDRPNHPKRVFKLSPAQMDLCDNAGERPSVYMQDFPDYNGVKQQVDSSKAWENLFKSHNQGRRPPKGALAEVLAFCGLKYDVATTTHEDALDIWKRETKGIRFQTALIFIQEFGSTKEEIMGLGHAESESVLSDSRLQEEADKMKDPQVK